MEVIASTVEVIWELGYICSSAVLICITDGTRPFASTTGGWTAYDRILFRRISFKLVVI